MRFTRLFLNRPGPLSTEAETVLVIDVLRSFTTTAVALAQGALAVYAVEDPAFVKPVCAKLGGALSVGAVAGGAPVPGFDFGNSPSALAKAGMAGKNVVISTAAGVRGLHVFRQASHLYAVSLVCARATVDAIRRTGDESICFVITGEWSDRDGDEDIACADYMELLLRGAPAQPQAHAQRVRQSDFGARFALGVWPNLPSADLDICADIDSYQFAMPVHHDDQQMVIHRADQSPQWGAGLG